MQPEIAVVAVPTASLVPYAANARTHSDSQVGQIGTALAQTHEPPSPLQQQTAALVRKLALTVALLCLLMVLVLLWRPQGLYPVSRT